MAESHRQVPRQPETRSEAPIVDPPKPPGGYLPDPPDVPAPTQARADYHLEQVSGGEAAVVRGARVEMPSHGPPTPTQEEADKIRGGTAEPAPRLAEREIPPHTPTQDEANEHRTRVMGAGPAGQYQTRASP